MTDAAVTRASPTITGMVLAAGAGSRMGTPKALLGSRGVPWLATAVTLLRAGGCHPVSVVLGADAERASALLSNGDAAGGSADPHADAPDAVRVVIAERWAEGLAHSLRAGLDAATGDAVVVTPVDMPGLPVTVLRRLLERPVSPTTLRQAVYNGEPGHPVVIGSAHWEPLGASLRGDSGARRYLAANGVEEVECSDLFDGHDIDDQQALAALRDREARQLPLG